MQIGLCMGVDSRKLDTRPAGFRSFSRCWGWRMVIFQLAGSYCKRREGREGGSEGGRGRVHELGVPVALEL